MGKYVVRRLLTAIPTILVISFIIFAIVDLSPSDPTGNLPLTIPPEVRQKIREALGADQPFTVKYVKWLNQFFIAEPLNFIEAVAGVTFPGSEDRTRVISWATRGPVIDIIIERLPQTLWVVGSSYILGVLIAVPVGVFSAYKQYSVFDQVGTFLMMIGFSVPTFFTGLMFIIIFSVNLKWFPSVYDTTLVVTDIETLQRQLLQMAMPVTVLTLYTTAQMSRYTARLNPGKLAAGLHPHSALQRFDRTGRRYDARRAQQLDPGGHLNRAGHPRYFRRRLDYRADIPCQWHRTVSDHRHSRRRPANRTDGDLHLRGSGGVF